MGNTTTTTWLSNSLRTSGCHPPDYSFIAKVVGTNKNVILSAIDEAVKMQVDLPYASSFGDGTAAQKTIEILKKNFA